MKATWKGDNTNIFDGQYKSLRRHWIEESTIIHSSWREWIDAFRFMDKTFKKKLHISLIELRQNSRRVTRVVRVHKTYVWLSVRISEEMNTNIRCANEWLKWKLCVPYSCIIAYMYCMYSASVKPRSERPIRLNSTQLAELSWVGSGALITALQWKLIRKFFD